jgi:hypothetical protein
MKRSTAVLAMTAAATAAALAVGPAAAAPTVSDPIVEGLAGPLQIDVTKKGIYVGQSFAGLLTKVGHNGSTTDLASEPGEIAGVSAGKHGVAYTFTQYDEETGAPLAAQLKLRKPSGKTVVVADLKRFEEKRNPDAHQQYGFVGLPKYCAEQVPNEIGGQPYGGIVESHPYAIANAPGGGWYVADAAGNDILKVTKHGKVKVVYLAKPQKYVVTADAAAGLGLPDCTVGHPYYFEGVPTDVEVGKHGKLYVSLLPGGPESLELGARGSVVLVNLGKHRSYKIGTGFLGATNLAVGPRGKVYVTELFGNKLSVLRHGHVRTVAELPMPAGVEYFKGKLYVATNVFENGQIVKVIP